MSAAGGPKLGGSGPPHPGPPRALLESSLYVADLAASRRFYEEVIGLKPLFADDRLVALDVGGSSVLLLFLRGGTTEPVRMPFGVIPPHDGSGELHMAFAVDETELDGWRGTLPARGAPIESEIAWPKGGRSLYVRDPDGHLVEFATKGLWWLGA